MIEKYSLNKIDKEKKNSIFGLSNVYVDLQLISSREKERKKEVRKKCKLNLGICNDYLGERKHFICAKNTENNWFL